MSISFLAQSIAESPTLAMNEQARILRESGQPVIHLGAGEPISKAPIDAIRTAAAKLSSADIRYTPADGTPAIKQAVLRYTEEHYDKVLAPENVVVSAGAKQSISGVLASIINQQDEVIIPAPYWVSYPELVKMYYGVPIIVKPEDGRFAPRMEDITRAVTGYTKAIIINSPNNPSGEVYTPEFTRAITEFCEEKGIYLIVDDIYHRLVFDGHAWTPATRFQNVDFDEGKLIVVNGASKLYAMTGFRIGWTVAPRKVQAAMAKVQAQTASSPSAISQAAAVGAINGLQSSVENLRLTLQNNAEVMKQELRAFNGVHLREPKGTFYCLADFSAYEKESRKLAQFLLKKVMVVTVPGIEFGAEGYLRLSTCGTVKEIMEGIARIKWALDPESPNEIYIGDRKMVRDWV
jgi:aspartate aminotransferase